MSHAQLYVSYGSISSPCTPPVLRLATLLSSPQGTLLLSFRKPQGSMTYPRLQSSTEPGTGSQAHLLPPSPVQPSPPAGHHWLSLLSHFSHTHQDMLELSRCSHPPSTALGHHTHPHTHPPIHMQAGTTHACTYSHMDAHAGIRTHAHTRAHGCTCTPSMQAHTHTCMQAHIHMHAGRHAHMHAGRHAHIFMQAGARTHRPAGTRTRTQARRHTL